MYEDALDILSTRDKALQNDKSILRLLSENNLSIPETWEQLTHIKNGSIRYSACQDFLCNQLGKGSVEQAGDVRIIYKVDDMSVSLPGVNMKEKQITIEFLRPVEDVNQVKKDEANKREKFLKKYIELLDDYAPVSKLVRARYPEKSEDWSDLSCQLYYFFIMHPIDFLSGKSSKNYWVSELKDLKLKQDEHKKDSRKVFFRKKQEAEYFKQRFLPKLQPFDLPVYIQYPGSCMSLETYFKGAGC